MKFNEKRNNNYSPNIEIIFLLNNLNTSQKTNSLERKKKKIKEIFPKKGTKLFYYCCFYFI